MNNETFKLLIVEKLLDKEFTTLEELMDIYSAKLYYYCSSILRNCADAEEAVQDTFIKVYNNIEKYNCDLKFSAWIYKIASNTAKDILRRRNGIIAKSTISYSDMPENDTCSKLTDREISDSRTIPDKIMQSFEISSIIIREINKLSDEHREVLTLRHIEDYSYIIISEILNCSVGTVKSRISRARNILKLQLVKINIL